MTEEQNKGQDWTKARSSVGQLAKYFSGVVLPGLVSRKKDLLGYESKLFAKDMSSFDPSYKAVYIVEQARSMKPADFISEINRSLLRISRINLELGKRISSLLGKDGKDEPIIAEISEVINNHDLRYICQYFYTHRGRIWGELGKLEDRKTAIEIWNRINQILSVYGVVKEQVRQIRTYSESIKRWDEGTEIEDSIMFLNNMIAKLKGLRGARLEDLENNDAIKQLRFYEREVAYLRTKLQQVELGEQDPNWERFRKFFGELSNMVKTLKGYFGDVSYAGYIERGMKDKERYGEQPEPWKSLLSFMAKELEVRRKEDIVTKARAALLMELKKVEVRMLKEFLESLSVRDIVGEIDGLTGVEKERAKAIQQEILKTINRFKSRLDERINGFRKNYTANMQPIIEESNQFEGKMERFIKEVDVDGFAKRMDSLLDSKGKLVDRIRAFAKGLFYDNIGYSTAYASRTLALAAGIMGNEERTKIQAWEEREKLRWEYGKLIREGMNVSQLLDRALQGIKGFKEDHVESHGGEVYARTG